MRSIGPENTLGAFLRARRETVQPEDVGILRLPGRRVPGLRREEVADLAGVSLDYYLRLEQGKDSRPSDQVVVGLARALLLDGEGRQYLMKLAQPQPFIRAAPEEQINDAVAELLTQWSHMPAYVCDANQNVLAVNPLATALASSILVPGINHLVAAYDDYAAFCAQPSDYDRRTVEEAGWEGALRNLTAALRFNGDPADPKFREVLGLLSERHPAFRRIWALHEAKPQLSGTSMFEVETFGWVELSWQTLNVPGPANLSVTLHFAAAGSRGADALAYLAARGKATNHGAELRDRPGQFETDELAAKRSTASRPAASEGTNTRTAQSS
ncbi:helix-turn-helix domain-containing protein [Herbiconiux sp. VKM Ac-1786]|uniref:helix-turn-helix transcriptional regulator n=1 Tax=Herbiconiux sp. VKM Ac-1786 TaxID=2783824 RepID=UPI00188ADDF4|nr:helix-turn-helix transcriptional regulator [Herbiconiux sp. VKM Ac-1786]MBF4572495.1 helix-turn-helix domain-containing protein [Herbiconiux sp. VKM Ac-1786]